MFLVQQQRQSQRQHLLLFIVLIHQQFLCHASWATRTPATTPAAVVVATTTTTLTTPLVSASEATLLTMSPPLPPQHFHAAAAASRHKMPADALNEIPTSSAEEEAPDPLSFSASDSDGKRAKPPRYKIISVRTNCTRDLFEMRIELNRGFRGLLYAKDFPLECRTRGSAHTNITLRLPTSGCGVRAEPRTDDGVSGDGGGAIELSLRVMLQMEQKLRQSSDILRTVRCRLPPNELGMNVMQPPALPVVKAGAAVATSRTEKSYRNGRMRTYNNNNNNNDGSTNHNNINQIRDSTQQINADATQTTQQQEQQQIKTTTTKTSASSAASTTTTTTTSTATTTTPRVRIWLELGGPDGSGAVEVGQATILTVRAIVPDKMGVRVVDCAALDGLGDSSQQLLDERGCPIDEQVMPALHTSFKPAEEGWSKPHENDLIEKTFSATFPAFKFPDRERLHVSCGVQLCKGKCPNLNCRTAEKLVLAADAHLARIEVFNSLAVTAPQIEVDRLRYDRRYNMSVEEYPPYVRPLSADGTLCLSVSKLALSFCILGLIFLIAVIVAICSLIRSRRRASSASHSCTLTTNGSRLHRAEVCTSMFSSSSESAHSARFGSKLFIPYYPNTLPYGRVY